MTYSVKEIDYGLQGERAQTDSFEQLAFRHFFLQPLDGPEHQRNTALAARYCLAHPRWRLLLQTHELVGLP